MRQWNAGFDVLDLRLAHLDVGLPKAALADGIGLGDDESGAHRVGSYAVAAVLHALDAPLEVTGPVSAVLFVSSSAPDTDFTARLVDVHPDGRAMNLCEGVLRARYRESIERAVVATSIDDVARSVARGILRIWAARGIAERLAAPERVGRKLANALLEALEPSCT